MISLLSLSAIIAVLVPLPCVLALSIVPVEPSTIKSLRTFLFQGYDVNARPVTNHTKSTMVWVELNPVHITDLNENRGILTLEAWVYMGWQDEHLKWDPKSYAGLKELQLNEKEIWKPDISIWEGRGSKISPWQGNTLEVNSSGYVEWVPAATIQVYCGLFDYENYPKDFQTCYVTLGSWAHDLTAINVTLRRNVTLHEFSYQNPHWDIVDLTAKREELEEYEVPGEKFATVEYALVLERLHVPAAYLEHAPNVAARVLVLCMFWLTSPTRKFLLGCTCLLILTAVAVGITVTLPGAEAAPFALHSVSCSLALCLAALMVEIGVTMLGECRLGLPSAVEKLASSAVVRLLTLCQAPALRAPKEDTQGIVPDGTTAAGSAAWPVLAALLDRIAFAVFAVLLLAL